VTRLILLTGFLGSGKTTLLGRLLRFCSNRHVGVIVNDFGEINIDARLIENDGITMRELSNGSIFCACIKDNFLKALIDMSHYEFEYLFIEASGLADPSSMRQILRTIANDTEHPYHDCGSICLLDGESFLEMNSLLPAVHNQLAGAGAVIVNKMDLMDSAQKSEILREVRKTNPAAGIYFTSYCDVDLDQLLSALRPSGTAAESTNTPENRPTTFTVSILPSVTMNELNDFLGFISPYTYRLKGFVNIGEASYSVSGVRSHIMLVPWPREIPSSEIVLISAVGIGLTGKIAQAIQLYAPKSVKLS
jgi:G3E family GTPase